jgi:NADPH:quinone reductase-like Zn-dependent oxidoreductase
MNAVIMNNYGGAEVLSLTKRPIPTPASGEILVKIHATGLNPVDFKIRQGHLEQLFPVKFPRILGGDISGVVISTSPDATDFQPGDEVFFANPLDRDGGYAEYVTVSQKIVARKPEELSHVEAASLPVVGLTTIQALRDFANIKPQDKVLIHAGAGGVGSFAIQYAKKHGAVVFTTASAAKADYVKSLGADHVIDYTKEDFTEVAHKWGGMDVIFETIGGDNYFRSILATKRGGAVPAIVNPPDEETKALALEKNIKTDFMLLSGERTDLQEISKLIKNGELKTSVSRALPLSQVPAAQTELETGRVRGKLVIDMNLH